MPNQIKAPKLVKSQDIPMGLKAGVISLAEVIKLPKNPKAHDLQAIEESLAAFGFIQRLIINTTTGHLLSGHGRVDALQKLSEAGEDRPVGVGGEGHVWLLPVDYMQAAEKDEMRIALALNKVQEKGKWEDDVLQDVLKELAQAEALAGTGFTEADAYAVKPPKLKAIDLPPPKRAWVLIGIPIGDYPDIAGQVEAIAANPKALVETVYGNNKHDYEWYAEVCEEMIEDLKEKVQTPELAALIGPVLTRAAAKIIDAILQDSIIVEPTLWSGWLAIPDDHPPVPSTVSPLPLTARATFEVTKDGDDNPSWELTIDRMLEEELRTLAGESQCHTSHAYRRWLRYTAQCLQRRLEHLAEECQRVANAVEYDISTRPDEP